MNPQFGPNEQTREQRQALFNQAGAINATEGAYMEPFAVELCKKYIEGEWTMQEVLAEVKKVHQARFQSPQAKTPPPPRPVDWPAAWPWYPTHYAWRKQAVFYEALNELDKLLERWPTDQELTLHLLATKIAFEARTPYWGLDEELPPDPELPEYDIHEARALREDIRARDPLRTARYAQNRQEAEAILASREGQQPSS